MSVQFNLFTDRRYHGEKVIEIEPPEVVSAVETRKKLIFAGEFDVTEVELTDGRTLVLEGHVKNRLLNSEPLNGERGNPNAE